MGNISEVKFDEVHFTVESVAEIRGITVQAVRKAIKEGRIAAKKVANTWFIPRRELDQRGWIKLRELKDSTGGDDDV